MRLFNDLLTARYETLERNIKSKSNSFYDSYLDLLETVIKYFLDENRIAYGETRTCGYIVRTDEAKEFFKKELKVDDYTFDILLDYIKKCNNHKHKKEKNIKVEEVISFLKVFFDFVNYYLDYIGAIRIEFNAEYFVSIFGETERLNNEFRLEVAKLCGELKESYEANKLSEADIETYKMIISDKDIELLNLDEQNQRLQAQISILKDIKLNSMEDKLNKTIDMLNNMQDYLAENRIIARRVSRLIDGKEISDEELKAEREKLEAIKNGKQ